MKLIRESFDRSVDRERRIADYRARHLSVVNLNEDTVKRNGKWANVGKDGKVDSGKFKTKKEADAQRKAMFANGYKGESLKEALSYPIGDLREVQRAIGRGTYEYGYSDHKADDIPYGGGAGMVIMPEPLSKLLHQQTKSQVRLLHYYKVTTPKILLLIILTYIVSNLRTKFLSLVLKMLFMMEFV